MADKEEKMTLDKLAQITQQEFLAIRETMATKNDLAALSVELREEMATKQELAAVRSDLRSAIDSSADRVVDEIKTFMRPHIKSLDAVLQDVEKIKAKVKV